MSAVDAAAGPRSAAPAYPPLPALPALVSGRVFHHRPGPVRHKFRNQAYQWLVDLDAVPRQPWYLAPFARFRSADHLGDPDASIKANVEAFLAVSGIALGDHGRIVMLANARVLGYVFDPLTVFWCYDSAGTLACIVAEVHNTYGQRHAYLLHPDAKGRSETSKEFYVSPFFDVSGTYGLTFTLTPDTVAATVILRHADNVTFSATFRGSPQPATSRALARTLLRSPLMPQRVSALIHAHGVWLWLRRLPLQPRPQHDRQEGV